MNKKIIAVSLTLLLMVVAFAACKGGGEEPASDTTYSYTKFGDIDVTVDGNGNLFVTNPDGDQIPVTSSKDGFYDDIKDLLTETKAPAVPEDSNADNNQENNNPLLPILPKTRPKIRKLLPKAALTSARKETAEVSAGTNFKITSVFSRKNY